MTLENRRWKAFLRLTGETLVERDDEILDAIIVNVEGGRAERFLGRTGPIRATAHAPTIERRRYKSSEAGP